MLAGAACNQCSTRAVVISILMLMLRRILVYGGLVLALAWPVGAGQPDVTTLGPAFGARVPAFSGIDQFGRTQTVESVLGPKGAMLVFFRSADW